jgi:hypothetical protein
MQIFISRSASLQGTGAIRSFYENWHLHDALYCFDRLMTAACADKLLLNTIPANQLFFVSELKKLAEGASLALMEELGRQCIEEYLTVVREPHTKAQRQRQKAHKEIVIDDREQRINKGNPAGFEQPENWMSAPLSGSEWECFPRHLTAEQFVDPWLAVEAFIDDASATERYEQLDILLEQALAESNIDNLITSSELVKMQHSWQVLLEGCHLLVVRGI